MSKMDQNQLYDKTLQTIAAIAKFPIVKVNRDDFLRKQFADSPYLDYILIYGPNAVYTSDSLKKKAQAVIKSSTAAASITSFATGLPSNPVLMVAAGGVDVVQYFGFAINMAQKIAYLFGEDELFDGDANTIPEAAKIRIIAYLGAMFGVAGANVLITKTAKIAGANIGKKVATQALTKTAWYPLVKKIGAMLGQKIVKKTVEKVIVKAVPVIGGVVSGGITAVTFLPMGRRLIDTFIKIMNGEFDDNLELNPEFLDKINREESETVVVSE